jgi:hypothetical protein
MVKAFLLKVWVALSHYYRKPYTWRKAADERYLNDALYE